MHRTKVEWADRAWNPITGCMKGCEYCVCVNRVTRFCGDIRYNKGQTEQYRTDEDLKILDDIFLDSAGHKVTNPFGFEPTYHRYRAKMLESLRTPMKFAVCYEGELFGSWVEDKYIKEIFDLLKPFSNHRFMFLTAYPERYEELSRKGILPEEDNYWYGWSVTRGNIDYIPDIKAHKYLAITPILGPIGNIPSDIEWVILGADIKKRKNQVIPEEIWIRDITSDCLDKNIPLFCESSIEPYVETMRKSYPQGLCLNEYSDVRKELYETDCNKCGRHGLKREMASIKMVYERGGSTPTIGFLCDKCYKTMCEDFKLQYVPKQ